MKLASAAAAGREDPGPAAAISLVQRFTVSFEYPVVFTDDLFRPGNPVLVDALRRREPERRHLVLAVIDDGVGRAWPGLAREVEAYVEAHSARLRLAAEPLLVAGGEAAKNDLGAVARLHARFHAVGLDRQSFVLVVGGGAVLDMAGYAAATTHRGLRTVRVPTTVLAQNDSGVGVKNGINAFGAKNLLGTFAPPFAVLNDRRFLATLSPRDRIAGMAEAVKVGLIRDLAFFEWLEANAPRLLAFEPGAVDALIRRSAELHLTHIATSGDPFEAGSARPLDFGHWAAHKLETLTGHALRHGEAVSIGMVVDARYSVEAGLLDASVLDRMRALLAALGLPLWHEALARRGPDGRREVLRGLEDFREHLGGELNLTLLREIGRGVEVGDVREEGYERALDWLRAHARAAQG
jgi:3-dehydroquinate synthase